jgi:hypothetical protein
MCVSINPHDPENHGCPSFHWNLPRARRYAIKNAKTSILNIPAVGYVNKQVTMCVCIFKIPFKREIPIYNPDFSSMDDEIWDYYETTVWDRETTSARFIQQVYRKRFRIRNESAAIIQERFREAIANPYTQLCRNRLLHEFEEMT